MARQAELLRRRELSAPELTELYLERIARLDPALNAYRVVLAGSAREEAAVAQRRLDGGEDASPLLGIPLAVKDNFDMAGELTTHGTGAVTRPAAQDAEVVRRLRAAGAVILGKTTLPELAEWGHFTESVTWGITRNPWDRERSPGGSSGGSGVAVAAGLAAAALGTDGGASVRVPAAMCGVFGLKPQRDRISLAPDGGHWHGLTHAGPLARSVLDAALLADAAAGGGDAFAVAARAQPGRLRIAVSLRAALPWVRPSAVARDAVERTARLLAELGHDVRTADPEYPATALLAGLGRRLRGRPLTRALRAEARVREATGRLFAEHDALLTPVIAAPPPQAGRWTGRGAVRTWLGMTPYIAYTGTWNVTGQPAASVPAGFDADGLPVAVQIIARPRREVTLLSLAAQLEAARPWAQDRPPLG